ncbi:class I SAM-dependent methyltransferase [Yinghuangia soli]|uniref:Class I SAM-dependent methyltransferase n=1 Tax=Yinghuangia soli TaxID=2908204 RepID=A0AA41Q2A7_9ACTN|nr:class I SAM-dependent methyltransferase [Yinghuangia soli]MCF2530245.1 class I SAM-dependent methyltransferase [Yinghuangia soli]
MSQPATPQPEPLARETRETLDAVGDQVAIAAAFWDAAFSEGRFLDLPPDGFVTAIAAAAEQHGLLPGPGLCIGPGNGRNYLPLVAAGLDLVGLDIAAAGLASLSERAPDRADRLVLGDLSALPGDAVYPVVIGLNVFQHGTRAQASAHISAALERVEPGGLFCLQVNSDRARTNRPHELVERADDGSFTVRYELPGTPGLYSHFFAEPSLAALLAGSTPVVPLHIDAIDPATGEPGPWHRWQGIYRRPDPAEAAAS